MINILQKTNMVLLVNSSYNNVLNRIENRELVEMEHNNLSSCILYLMHKSWMPTYTLYNLATIIAEKCPDNLIDWKNTFFVVEKIIYLDLLADSLLPKEKDSIETVINKLKFYRDQSTPENHKIIEEIANQKLTNYHLN